VSMIFTIGYEGADLRSFLSVLDRHDISHVVDVRLTPFSRRSCFSKRSLARALKGRGIRYSHYPELGCPKDIRVVYAETGDFESYSASYQERVLARSTTEIQHLAREARGERTCLLCFEADANRCHRSIVAFRAAEVSRNAFGFYHLLVPS